MYQKRQNLKVIFFAQQKQKQITQPRLKSGNAGDHSDRFNSSDVDVEEAAFTFSIVSLLVLYQIS